jgi:YidC/Oxa1 family membrane protein insertase
MRRAFYDADGSIGVVALRSRIDALEFITTPFLNVLLLIYLLVKDFGLAIILFTVLIRVITYPLNASQLKSSRAMQEFNNNKEWQEIQKKYKDNREKLAQEQMRLYKELGVNPFKSCLPTLIQLPIWLGLYQGIMAALAQTPLQLAFLERHIYAPLAQVSSQIPLDSQFLWMNLGQPERLTIPGLNFGIPVLAVLVVITSYVQSKVAMPATGGNDQGAQMSKMMTLYMPFLMGWMALTLASGLALYFFVSNLLSIGQSAAMGQVNWKALLPGRKPAAAKAEVKPERRPAEQAKTRKDEPRQAKKAQADQPAQSAAQHARESRAARRKKPVQQVKKKKR